MAIVLNAAVVIDGIYYNLNNNEKTAEVAYGIYSGVITIPSVVAYSGYSYSVTGIGDMAFKSSSQLISVTIPNSVTTIGDYAFDECHRLGSVTIPNSVASIGNYAFSDCSALTSIDIPNSVTNIGEGAFYGCSVLTSVSINSNEIMSNTCLRDFFDVKVTSYVIGDDVNPTLTRKRFFHLFLYASAA